MVIFVFDDGTALRNYLLLMAGAAGNSLWGGECLWYLRNYGVLLMCATVLAFPVYPWIRERTEKLTAGGRTAVACAGAVGYIGLFLLATAYLVSDTYNPFLYFRF